MRPRACIRAQAFKKITVKISEELPTEEDMIDVFAYGSKSKEMISGEKKSGSLLYIMSGNFSY